MALIFLLLITMLAISASQRSLLQQRMAGSLRSAQQARMSAETALRGAEYKIWSIASHAGVRLHCQEGGISADDGCIIYRALSAPYGARGVVTTFQKASGWVENVGKSYAGPMLAGYMDTNGEPTAVLARNPVYLIEDLGSERPPGVGSLHESGNTGPNNRGADEVDVHVYRITARGAGGNPVSVSVVQSTFSAPASP
ncbi:PilX N-terminal domain-containing pilus assembly protein [Dyella sp. M7H15-1]|uniref:pilus assembly PilX family protein n=1 Tax=Dyella sp. M7H15-1 TaxID=2501295 RepID=UPI0013E8E28C|nr:PilX N-terminal domain-containing pilus assembly protein [Dyella sp. M7H15-1]